MTSPSAEALWAVVRRKSSPHFILVSILAAGLLALMLPACLSAQAVDRIWARVETVTGKTYEGFIRWDRNEASWVDLLSGEKNLDVEGLDFRIWNERVDSAMPPRDRVIEFGDVRVSWPDMLEDFPSSATSGVRFGHLRSLTPTGDNTALLELKSGESVELRAGSTDLGLGLREILVDVPGGDVETLHWGDLARVDFRAVPPIAQPRNQRIYGTVTDVAGNEYSGAIAWDVEKIFLKETLTGNAGLRERRIPFGEVVRVDKTEDGAQVTLDDGETLELTGSEDVTSRNDGIEVSDPDLGVVSLAWRAFQSARFHPHGASVGYDRFDGGHPLEGTVVTLSGRELSGRLRFDVDEGSSWEILNGIRDHVTFDVEFADVVSIEPVRGVTTRVNVGAGVNVDTEQWRGARVTLADGRVIELAGSNDVDEGNKGVLVRSWTAEGAPWILVEWKDVKVLRIESGPGGTP